MMSHDDLSSETNSRYPLEAELVSAFFDGETTPEERAAVEASMDEGGETLQVLDEYDQLSQSLKQLHRAAGSPDLAQAVLAQVRPAAVRVDPPPSKPRRLLSIAAGLSGLAVAVLLLVWPRPDVQRENTLAVNESPFLRTGAEAAVSAPAGRSFSMDHVADSAVPLPSPGAPGTAEMEASITSSLAEIASEHPLPEVGDVVGYLDENAEELTWVAVTVVDVQTAGDRVQLLLTQHGVESPESAESAPARASESESQMTFLVEADWDQLEAVIVDLTDADYVDALAVNAPSSEGVPEVLQEYVVTRADPSARSGGNASTQVLRERVQQRQTQPPLARADDASDLDEAVQLQLQVPETVLQRLAARRGVTADLAASKPAASDPPAADTPEAARAEGPPREVAPTALGRPMASRRARAVIVIQRHNR